MTQCVITRYYIITRYYTGLEQFPNARHIKHEIMCNNV